MDSISLLLEASEVHSRAEEYSRRASFDDTMCVESQSPEIEGTYPFFSAAYFR